MIPATPEFGLLLRKKSLSEKEVALAELTEAMKGAEQVGEDAHLISYGPCFGAEALDGYIKSLQNIGLDYWDDFVEFSGDFPSWCRFRVYYSEDGE